VEQIGNVKSHSLRPKPLDVYISCSQEDDEWAKWVAWILRRAGYTVSDARFEADPGADIEASTRAAVRNSAVFLVILSHSSFVSGFVSQEWKAVWKIDPEAAGSRIVTLLVSPVEPPGLLARSKLVPLYGSHEEDAEASVLRAVSGILPGRLDEMRPNFPPNTATRGDVPNFSRLIADVLFVGREEELHRLRYFFTLPTSRVVGISGPGGIGKTSLALEYARLARDKYRNIIHLHNGQDLQRWILDTPALERGSLLLIVDNLQDSTEIREASRWIQDRTAVDAILISRSPINADPELMQISLHPMSQSEARQLLRMQLPDVRGETIDELESLVGGLPLVLRLTAILLMKSDSRAEDFVRSLKRSLSRIPSDGPDGNVAALSLAETYFERFSANGSLNDAFEAERILRRLLEADPQSPPVWTLQSVLGVLLDKRHQLTGSPEALGESITLLRRALDVVPPGHPDRPAMLSNLAAALRSHSNLTGSPEALGESIFLLRMALNEMPPGHPDQPAILSNLAAALRSRSDLTGSPEELSESITLLRMALNEMPPGHPDQPAISSNLAAALRSRSDLTGSREDNAEAQSLQLEVTRGSTDPLRHSPLLGQGPGIADG
jgi:tetratricopeptide (TPR) repeat protein